MGRKARLARGISELTNGTTRKRPCFGLYFQGCDLETRGEPKRKKRRRKKPFKEMSSYKAVA